MGDQPNSKIRFPRLGHDQMFAVFGVFRLYVLRLKSKRGECFRS